MSKSLTSAQWKYWERRLRWIDAWQYGDPRYKANQKQAQFEKNILSIGGTNEIEIADGINQRVNLKKTGNCLLDDPVNLIHESGERG